MATIFIIGGLIAAIFLFYRDCDVVATIVKLAITLSLFFPMLTAVNASKSIVSVFIHPAVGWAMVPLCIYLLLYIIFPKSGQSF